MEKRIRKNCHESSNIESRVDISSYLEQHEILYQTLSSKWQNGLVIGNGDLHGVVFGEDDLEWGITKIDVADFRYEGFNYPLSTHQEVLEKIERGFDERLVDPEQRRAHWGPNTEYGYANCPPTFKHCARLKMRFYDCHLSSNLTSFEQRLSLYNACVTTIFKSGEDKGRTVSFVSALLNVLVIHSQFNTKKNGQVRIDFKRDTDEDIGEPILGTDGEKIWIDYEFPDGFRYAAAMSIVGAEYTVEEFRNAVVVTLQKEESVEFTLYIAVSTSHEGKDPLKKCSELLDKAQNKGYGALLQEHQEWWGRFWSKSFISLSDKFVENLWYISLYALASSARNSSFLPQLYVPGYLGEHQGWHGVLLTDINLQEIYWLTYTSNHTELGDPFYRIVERDLPYLKEETKKLYGIDGVKLPGVLWFNGGHYRELGYSKCRYMQHVSAWYAELYWWRYLYTQDKQFLRETAYPIMKEITHFYEGYLQKDENGKYYIFPSFPPEQGDWRGKNPGIDIALMRELFRAMIEASDILAVDTNEKKKWQDILSNLSDYPNNGWVFLDSEYAPADLPLGHPALLTCVFPVGDIGVDSPKELYDMAKRTFDGLYARTMRKCKDFVFDLPTWDDDMTWPWILCIAARLGLADTLRSYLYDISILQYLKNNGLFTYNIVRNSGQRESKPAFLNSSTGFGTAISEMLLQSYDGKIRVFPAIPDEWECKFVDLRAVGAFLVSSEISQKRVKYVQIKSLEGKICTLVNSFNSEVQVFDLEKKEKVNYVNENDGVIVIDTIKNHSYLVQRIGEPLRPLPKIVTENKTRRTPRKYLGPSHIGSNIQCKWEPKPKWTVYLGKPKRKLFEYC